MITTASAIRINRSEQVNEDCFENVSPNETDVLVKDGYKVVRSSLCRNSGVAASKSYNIRLNEEISVAQLAENSRGSALAAGLDCPVVISSTSGLWYFFQISSAVRPIFLVSRDIFAVPVASRKEIIWRAPRTVLCGNGSSVGSGTGSEDNKEVASLPD